MEKISGFFGEYRWLSNFHLVDLDYDGKIWPSTEHLYQALKSLDKEVQEKIRTIPTPKEVKRASKTINPIRSDWNTYRLEAMALVTSLKYQHDDLRDKLLATGDAELIEENTWGDCFWGVCNGVGENWLGKILMDERKKLMLSCFRSRMV